MNEPAALLGPDSAEYRARLAALIEAHTQHMLTEVARESAFTGKTAATLAAFAAIGAAARIAAGLARLNAQSEQRRVHQAEVDMLVGSFRGLLLELIEGEGSRVSSARN